MLHEFLTTHRQELIMRCREKVALRIAPGAREAELDHGIGYFLEQLIETLELEQTANPQSSRRVSGASGGGTCRSFGDCRGSIETRPGIAPAWLHD